MGDCFASSRPNLIGKIMPIYARCKSDLDTAWWNYSSRSSRVNWHKRDRKGTWGNPPATVSLSKHPAGHTKDRFRMPKKWLSFAADLNGGKKSRSFKALMRKSAGWNNVGSRTNPKIESLAWWGSVLEIVEFQGKYARIKTLHFKSKPPNPKAFNYQSHPELFHQFTAISKSGKMYLLAKGYRAFSIALSRGPLWVPMDRIELFPELPMKVVIQVRKLNVRENPTLRSKRLSQFSRKEETTIREYAVRGRDVWGKTEKGWIAISLGKRPKHFTSWSMKTRPAL